MRMYPLFLLAVLAITACDTQQAVVGATGTPPIRVAGAWKYSNIITTANMTVSCQITDATAGLTQGSIPDNFGGYVQGIQTCVNTDTNEPQSVFAFIVGGELYGNTVRFVWAGCTHTGTASGDPVNHMVGISTCSFPLTAGGNNVDWTGTWEATR